MESAQPLLTVVAMMMHGLSEKALHDDLAYITESHASRVVGARLDKSTVTQLRYIHTGIKIQHLLRHSFRQKRHRRRRRRRPRPKQRLH